MIRFDTLRPDQAGLVVAVVQDGRTGSVLMVGYMDESALTATYETGQVHFWSRSRDALWRKGETSGNTLRLLEIHRDCDGDALLVRVIPDGPTCHTGDYSCFADPESTLGATIDQLVSIIEARAESAPPGSYTATLLADLDLAARKVLEEAGEVAFAAKDLSASGEARRVTEEAADVLYHLLALLRAADVDAGDVGAELRSRMG